MMEKIFSMKKSTYLEQNLKYMLPKTSIQQITEGCRRQPDSGIAEGELVTT